MKSSFIAAAVACAALIGTSACGLLGNDSRDDAIFSFSKTEARHTFVLRGSAADYGTDDDILYSCRADIMMPVALGGSEALPDSIRSLIMAKAFGDSTVLEGNDAIEAGFRTIASNLGYTLADTLVADNCYDGCYILEGDIATLTPSILSYAITLSTYEPMETHGMYGTSYVNCYFADKKASIITLSDIITDEGRTALPSILRGIASTMRRFIGWTDLRELPADDNFYIDLRNNIVFVYQPYEIASYSQGIIEIPVPAYQISDYLTPTGKEIFNL